MSDSHKSKYNFPWKKWLKKFGSRLARRWDKWQLRKNPEALPPKKHFKEENPWNWD